MLIYTNPVFDIASGERVSYDQVEEYTGPVLLLHSKQSEAEKRALANQENDRKDAKARFAPVNAFDAQYIPKPGQTLEDTPGFKDDVNSGYESTVDAYDQAKSTGRLKARMAGFGYTDPFSIEQDAGLENEEAGAIADVPRQARETAYGRANNAAGRQATIGTTFLGSSNDNLQIDAKAEQERLNRRGRLLGALISAGASIATAGVSNLGKKADG